MLIPLSWLKDHIDSGLPPQKIAKILTSLGLEVDALLTTDTGYENIVIGEVLETAPHPDADKLQVATVTDGQETFQVVCGAPNCRKGLKTAFARLGAKIPDGEKTFKVKKSKIRGVESFGMLCSGKELGVSEEAEGILELAEHLQLGIDVSTLFSDTIFEVSLTPNLNHCASIIGTAREVAAATESQVTLPQISLEENSSDPTEAAISVVVQDPERCPRYCCRLVRGVKVAPSPQWMQDRLKAAGIRPINNIVDVTNFVLTEMGHPMHAFDYDLIDGKKINVRTAKEGERFITLDDKERALKAEDLLICDGEKPVAIAGIMGGNNSEVHDGTTNVLLEAAYFLPTAIRRTSKRLGLMTESSKRFERGCDPNALLTALDRAAALIVELAGGSVSKGILDVSSQKFTPISISCRLERVNKMLGTKLSVGEIESIFQRLEMTPKWDGKGTFTVTIPTYRVDVTEETDLVEEIARLYGYDNIPRTPARYSVSPLSHAPIFLFEREVRSRLIAHGLQEFLTCDLIGPSLLEVVQDKVMPDNAMIHVKNPTSIEQSILRTSLLPALLQVVKYNIDHDVDHVCGFEVGRVHFKQEEEYKEQSVAGVILCGSTKPHHWSEKGRPFDFFDLKGVFENLFQEIGIQGVEYRNNGLATFHAGRQASMYLGHMELGSIGEVNPAIKRRLDVPSRILFGEVDLHNLFQKCGIRQMMTDVPQYPGSERDLTLTLKEETSVLDVLTSIKKGAPPLLEEVSVYDLYRSERLGKGLKNVTLRFVYRDMKKTISQESVDKVHGRIVESCQEKFVQT